MTLFLISALNINAFSQFFTTTKINTSTDKIYNKQTGKLLTDDELKQIANKNPNIPVDQIINKYGEIEYFEYDPNKKNRDSNDAIARRPKTGEAFPPFVMKSIDNKTLDSEKLIGRIILLQFQLDFDKPFFFAKTLIDANELINELQNKVEITSVVVTKSSKEDILNQIDPSAYNMEFVPNARNFIVKYFISYYPSFILIDKYGKLVSYYDTVGLNKVKEDLLKIE